MMCRKPDVLPQGRNLGGICYKSYGRHEMDTNINQVKNCLWPCDCFGHLCTYNFLVVKLGDGYEFWLRDT